MNDDKALLEAAARAAGMRDMKWAGPSGMVMMIDPSRPESTGSIGPAWNPLTDDGDALRLALKLRLSIIHSSEYIQGEEIPTVEVIGRERPNGSRHCEMHSLDDDPAATVRRCIVMAAAASLGQEAKHG